MKEMDDGARVWRIYNDESERIDNELVDGWVGTLDTLLIFAGLFSAVIATFLTQTAQSLQQDFTAVTASLLTEMVALQRATALGADVSQIPSSTLTYNSSFTSSSRDVWLNSLWLVSLALTLSTALVTGLVKQWLNYYLADVTGMPKNRACTRQYRYTGLTRWGVPLIIELLPVLMNASLFLFFAGLVLFTQDLSSTAVIRWLLIGLTTGSFVVYVGSSFIPIRNPQCPYKSSLSKVYTGFISLTHDLLVWISQEQRDRQGSPEAGEVRNNPNMIKLYLGRFAKTLGCRKSLRIMESNDVSEKIIGLQQDAIVEIGMRSTNPTVPPIAIQALAGFHAFYPHRLSVPEPFTIVLKRMFRGCFHKIEFMKYELSSSKTMAVERYSRAMSLLLAKMDTLDAARIISFTDPPETINEAVLLACVAACLDSWKSSTSAMHFILSQPPIELSRVHPWHLRRLRGAIVSRPSRSLYSNDDDRHWREHTVVAMLERLSPTKALTLQEDLLIRSLYAYCVCLNDHDLKGKDTPGPEQKARETNVIIPLFLELLPSIADCTLSMGSGSKVHEDFLRAILAVDFSLHIEAIGLSFDGGVVHFRIVDPNFHDSLVALDWLLHRLILSWEDMDCWKGNVLLHIKAVTMLHRVCIYRQWGEEDILSMFHWLLVIALRSHNCPMGVGELQLQSAERELLLCLYEFGDPGTYRPSRLAVDTFKFCCSFVTTKQLLGLPRSIMAHFIGLSDYLLGTFEEPIVLERMDFLFRHFFQQDPLRVDPVYPMTYSDQYRTLTSLIEFARRPRSNGWEDLVSSWRDLVHSRLLENAETGNLTGNSLGDSSVMESDALEAPLSNSCDLRDVLWMLEGGAPNLSLGEPLNFQSLLDCFDKPL